MMAEPAAVEVFAPAKINLYLHVLGRRSDGYHELDSLVMFAGVGDRLTLTPADHLSLELGGRFGPALPAEPPGQNLVVRAAETLGRNCNRAPAFRITLDKELPVASGIGGGSADAAACLRGLARSWAVPLDDPGLHAVATRLGADVPVCVMGRAAYFAGIGDRIEPAPGLPDCPAVLVNPGRPLPTPAVFRARQGAFSAPGRLERPPRDPADLAAMLSLRGNDLTAPAIALEPSVAAALAALESTPDCRLARLSGSGATCFGLYSSAKAATAAAADIVAREPGWWVVATTLTGSAGA